MKHVPTPSPSEVTPASVRPLLPVFAPGGVPTSRNVGPLSQFCFLPLEKLVIDDRYQRSIGSRGRQNVLSILAQFDWRKFTPVVVAPLGNGLFAVIDGQHRATAALMHPDVESVPCMVIDVTPEEAAACFAAINGQVTAISQQQIFYARVAAGDANAVALKEALDAAGVRVLKWKNPTVGYRTGDTLAVGTLHSCMKLYGRDTLVTALKAIVESGDGNPGCLVAPLISALCSILAQVGQWRNSGEKLLIALDELNLDQFIADCAAEGKKRKQPAHKVIARRMAAHLAQSIQRSS